MLAKIMIVEDNPDIRQALEVQLKTASYDTVWAEDASGAIELCAEEAPDLILLDLGLVGGDGFMVMERLQQLNAKTPIIVLSARDPDLNEALALQLGAVEFMEKPWKMNDLLAAIRQFVGGHKNDLCGACSS
jgi:two-component system KDP operon response regulator KdpE